MDNNIIQQAIQQAALQQQMYMQMPYMQFNGFPPDLSPMMAQMYPMPHPLLHKGAYEHAGQLVDDDEDDDDDEDQRTLFCGNLDDRMTEEILYEVFLQAGPIESARIPKDNTGKQRNFGFVTYLHACAAPFAMELYQGLELFQKKVNIRSQGADKPSSSKQQQRQHNDANFASPSSRLRNPFMMDGSAQSPQDHGGAVRHGRRTLHEAKPYDRAAQNNNYHNDDRRRRSDSAVMERNRQRNQQQQHHNNDNGGGNRRSDQRNQGRRRLL